MKLNNIPLIVRVFAEAPDAETAKNIRDQIALFLESFCIIQQDETEKYWKIKEYFEITFWLSPRVAPQQAFNLLLEQSPSGWSFYDDPPSRNAVWNFSPGLECLAPQVRWAELILAPLVDPA
jgi:hypothetical protein